MPDLYHFLAFLSETEKYDASFFFCLFTFTGIFSYVLVLSKSPLSIDLFFSILYEYGQINNNVSS